MSKLVDCVEILDSQRIPVSSADRKKQKNKIYPYYGAQGVIDYVDEYIFDGEYILVAEDGNNLKALNESIVTWATGKIWVNNHAHILGEKEGFNLKYIYYLLRVMDLRGYITGSDQPKLSQENLAKVELELPPKPEQDRIAEMLSAMDEKINNNNSIYDDLSSVLKLLFSYWFVQYNFPSKEGKPYKSSGSKLVWNDELHKEIPEDWEIKSLFEIADLDTNSVNPIEGLEYEHYSIPAFDADCVPVIEDGASIASNKYEVPDDSILISKLNPQFKRIWPIANAKNGICSTEFCPIIGKTISKSFLYCLLDGDEAYTYMVNSASSSTGSRKRIQPEVLMKFRFAFPKDMEIINAFSNKTQNIIEQMIEIKKENHIIREERDLLIPLLVTGAVSIKD